MIAWVENYEWEQFKKIYRKSRIQLPLNSRRQRLSACFRTGVLIVTSQWLLRFTIHIPPFLLFISLFILWENNTQYFSFFFSKVAWLENHSWNICQIPPNTWSRKFSRGSRGFVTHLLLTQPERLSHKQFKNISLLFLLVWFVIYQWPLHLNCIYSGGITSQNRNMKYFGSWFRSTLGH